MSEAGREEDCRQRGRATEEETAARPTVGALRGALGDMGLAIGMSLTKFTTVMMAVTGEEKVM